MVKGGGAKPWRQKGTGRARQGTTACPQWSSGGVVFGPHPRELRRQGEQEGAPQGAPHRAQPARAAGSLAVLRRRRRSAEPSTKDAPALRDGWRRRAPAARDRRRPRGEDAAVVVPQPRAHARRRVVYDIDVADVMWARGLVVTRRPSTSWEGGDVSSMTTIRARHPRARCRVEKSYGLIAEFDQYMFKVHPDANKKQIRQAVELLIGVTVLEREHAQRQGQAEAPRPVPGHPPRLQACRRAAAPPATPSRSSRGCTSMPTKKFQADLPGPPLHGDHRLR